MDRSILKAIFSVFALSLPIPSYAEVSCEPLRPTPPQNINTAVFGRIDSKIQRFTDNGGGRAIEGAYTELVTDVLKEYPSADRLYLWGRMLYLYCENIRASALSDREKITTLNDIARRIDNPPPPSGDSLLDPPILQVGMTRAQVQFMMRARDPKGFADIDQTIVALQSFFVNRHPSAIPRGSESVISAAAKLFGVNGHGHYGFDQNDRLSWVNVWNICTRDKHEFANARDVHNSWLVWRDHKDIGIDDAIACDKLTHVITELKSGYGEPVMSDTGSQRGSVPSESEICYDLYMNPVVTCARFGVSKWIEKHRFLASDRITAIDLSIVTLRYSALKEGSGMTKFRERKSIVLTVSNPSGPAPIPPVVSGLFFRYLN